MAVISIPEGREKVKMEKTFACPQVVKRMTAKSVIEQASQLLFFHFFFCPDQECPAVFRIIK